MRMHEITEDGPMPSLSKRVRNRRVYDQEHLEALVRADCHVQPTDRIWFQWHPDGSCEVTVESGGH